jgi:uncharacterized protein (TIGR03067 family)
MKTVPLLAVAVSLLIPVNDTPTGDAKDIQGTWRVILLQDSGETVPIGKDSRVVITAERLKLKDRNYPLEVVYRLDASKNPKWIDLGMPPAQHKGIYELKGDALKICYNERPRGERADAFVSLRDSPNDVLLVLQREKR